MKCGNGFFFGLRNDNAFAKGKSVCLNDRGERSRFDVGNRFFEVVKHLARRGGNAVFFHQIFGKDLASFDLRCCL